MHPPLMQTTLAYIVTCFWSLFLNFLPFQFAGSLTVALFIVKVIVAHALTLTLSLCCGVHTSLQQ